MSERASYVVAVPGLQARLHASGELRRVDPRQIESAPFIETLRGFAELAYAPLGMRTPRWVLYDCAVMPGLMFGLARPDGRPASMLVALPTLDPAHWFIYDLIDITQMTAGVWLEDLREPTLRAAIALLGARTITATASPRSAELAAHASIAPLEVLADAVPVDDGRSMTVVRYRPASPELAPRNEDLLPRLELFVVARPETRAHFEPRPFGIEPRLALDPLDPSSRDFLALLERLDEVTFGPVGMPMPRWVFLDGAEMTGGIVGFGRQATDLSPEARELLGVDPGYRGLVPLAVFIAIPTHEPGEWFGHNLASVASLLPDENLRGLGSLTKAVALRMFRADAQVGATQWDSRALFVHTRLGPLELITAHTPAHGEGTLTYRATLDDAALRHLARDRDATVALPEPGEWIASSDLERRIELQRAIEAGERFAISGRPRTSEAGLEVPIVALPRLQS